MNQLLWLTDVHFNFIRPGAVEEFGKYLCKEQDFDGVIISGDISEAPTLCGHLEEFATGLGKPVYFVLGNHDYYKGSISAVEAEIAGLAQPNLVWLRQTSPILLNDSTALVGVEGWYDGVFGNAERSRVIMSDFILIEELKPLFHEQAWLYHVGGRTELLQYLRKLAQEHADLAATYLRQALAKRDQVLFVTHYPPFAGACWHEGKLSDSHWMPWFTCGAMGKMLADVAVEYPSKKITVLCGHTHGRGVYRHLHNLIVYTGRAKYSAPDVAGVIDVSYLLVG